MRIKPAILFLFLAALLAGGCTRFQILNATVPHTGYRRTASLAYGPLPRQELDVYRPRHAAPQAKVVVFFYGGSWRTGSKEDYRFVAQALSSRGFVVVMPDYRLYPPATFPAFVDDGALAVRWTHDNIEKFGGDPSRIYLMGHSAGAYIAVMLTLNGEYLAKVGLDRSVIRATAGLSGPYDFVPDASDREVFGLAPKSPRQAIEPANFVDGKAPPLLLIQGLNDRVVSPANTTELAGRIRERGGKVTEITFPHRGHLATALALAYSFRWLSPVLDDVCAFFNSH